MKMQESVLARVRIVEEKNGIKYAKPDGRLHKVMRVLYTLLFAYTMGINLIFIAGMFMLHYGTDNFPNVMNTLITVCVCTGLIIAGFILYFILHINPSAVLYSIETNLSLCVNLLDG